MAEYLVIVESPSKSKTIGQYLGSDYIVKSSKGHVRDLSISGSGGLGIDVEKNFKLFIGQMRTLMCISQRKKK